MPTKIKVPSRGSTISDATMALSALIAGSLARRKEKKEEAREETLLGLRKEEVAQAGESHKASAEYQRGMIENARATLEQRRSEVSAAAEEREETQREERGGVPALVQEVQRLSKKVTGREMDEAALQAMTPEQLVGSAQRLQTELQSKIHEMNVRLQQQGNTNQQRLLLSDQLRGVETEYSQALALRDRLYKELSDAPATTIGGLTDPMYLGRLIDQRLAEQRIRPIPDIQATRHQLLGEIAKLGGGSIDLSYTSDPLAGIPDPATVVPAEMEKLKRSVQQEFITGADSGRLSRLQARGYPVNQWVAEVMAQRAAATAAPGPISAAVQAAGAAFPSAPGPAQFKAGTPRPMPPTSSAAPPAPGPPSSAIIAPQVIQPADTIMSNFAASTQLRRRGSGPSTTPPTSPGGISRTF